MNRWGSLVRVGAVVAGVAVFATVGLLAGPALADELADLVDQADMAYRGSTSAAVLTMQVKTSSYERTYEMVMWGDTRGGETRTLVKILGPALWRGFGTLKVGPALKLFDPEASHVTVVGHSMLGDSWMGSHFSNDDLVKETRLGADFEASLLARSVEGNVERDRIALTPRPTAPVPWGRVIFEIERDATGVRPVQAAYYRKASDVTPERTLTFTDVRELGGRRLPAVITVTVAAKPGEYTRIEYKTLKLGLDVPAAKFTEAGLRK